MSEPDVATIQAFLDQEFNGGEVTEVEAPVEPDTPEPTASERARDPETGRFVSEKEEESPEVVETSAEDEAPAEGNEADQEDSEDDDEDLVFDLDDPEVLEILEKYQNDPVKAIKALAHAQEFLGRKGVELDELVAIKNQLAELQWQQAANTPYQGDIDEDPALVAQEVVQRAIQGYGFDDRVYEAAIAAWADEDPGTATRFDSRVQMARWQAQQQVASQSDETSTLTQEFTALKERHPDMEKHLPAIEKILMERPLWQDAISQGDARARAQAFEDVYLLARSQSEASDTSAAARKIALRVKKEADKAREDAAVVTQSNAGAVEPPRPNEKLTDALKSLTGLDDLEIDP